MPNEYVVVVKKGHSVGISEHLRSINPMPLMKYRSPGLDMDAFNFPLAKWEPFVFPLTPSFKLKMLNLCGLNLVQHYRQAIR